MANNHGPIRDTDPHFIIDPLTRKLHTESSKIILVQGDHNSERFTFEVPTEIEGHKMDLTNKVQIHFLNIEQMTKKQSAGLYEADDVAIEPAEGENPARVKFSWLIDHTATKYQGALNFVVRFLCEDETSVTYSWSTAIYSGISVTDGINNGEAIVEEYHDILKAWELELKANQVVSLEQTTVGDADAGENVWTATFGDGRKSELRVKNGSRGPTGYIGSIETIDGKPLKFFYGTRAQYEALTNAQKAGLFAIITDDTTKEGLLNAIASLESRAESLEGRAAALEDKTGELLPSTTLSSAVLPGPGWYFGHIYSSELDKNLHIPLFYWHKTGVAEYPAALPYSLRVETDGTCKALQADVNPDYGYFIFKEDSTASVFIRKIEYQPEEA